MNFTIPYNHNNADVRITPRSSEGGVELYDIDVSYPEPTPSGAIIVRFYIPTVDIYSVFMPGEMYDLSLRSDWCAKISGSSLNGGAPVMCFISADGRNRLTVTHDDFIHPVNISEGVNEFSKSVRIDVKLFAHVPEVVKDYHLTLRLDFGDKRYDAALRDVISFWENDCGVRSVNIPDAARRPLYSCWYTFHQDVTPDAIVAECERAKKYGMDTVIVDDGWQCDDSNGGYRYCGDWEPADTKIPDMADFVRRVHDCGMKAMIWYNFAGVGIYSKAHERFRDMLLNPGDKDCAELDPRFPAVREYLVGKFRDAIVDWDLDGFKLDFVDAVYHREGTLAPTPDMDHENVEDALDALLTEITDMAHSLKPEFMIEFRQMFFGPGMRRFATMFRVGDCANDSIRNRVVGIGMRHLLGSSPVHSDMIMWNVNDTPESVMTQLLSCLFVVPQISVPLDMIPDEHRKALAFFLGFWNEHRDTILDGMLCADNPESCYSRVTAEKDGECVTVSYTNPTFDVTGKDRAFVFNATAGDKMYIRSDKRRTYEVRDCMGGITGGGTVVCGITEVTVGRCGMVEIR